MGTDDTAKRTAEPLASRMRPADLSGFVGQEHLLEKGSPLYRAISSRRPSSMIFYGPPGTGKTTLARAVAGELDIKVRELKAVSSGVDELRGAIKEGAYMKSLGERLLVFVDEVHRLNRAQQDVILHALEDGTILMIGATVENPFFYLNPALLSRCEVLEFKSLSDSDLTRIALAAIEDSEHGLGADPPRINSEALDFLVSSANGDARKLLGFLERLQGQEGEIDEAGVHNLVGMQARRYDRQGDLHYDIVSAFIKSMRASDPDAALYWMARMLNGGEDPRFVARRMMIFASEDVGNADPLALLVATSAMEAVKAVGMPEAAICLSQAVTYLSLAEKSNASYLAWSKASDYARKKPDLDVPIHYKDANYTGAARLGRGTGYEYPHDFQDAAVAQKGLDEDIVFYEPLERGREARLRERLERVREIRGKANRKADVDSKRGKA